MIQPRPQEYKELPARLAQEVPAVRASYEEYLKRWRGEEPGSHNVFGDLLNPYLISLLSENGDPNRLAPVFRILEDLRLTKTIS